MNGIIYTREPISDEFVPAARLNQAGEGIALVHISGHTELAIYSAAEARRYEAMFAEAARLLDEAEGGIGK